ncbi:MAG: hypothetical protein IJN03_01975 [Bacilli bacterium]|nr:hypothetical protein [Bacilli bacterium]
MIRTNVFVKINLVRKYQVFYKLWGIYDKRNFFGYRWCEGNILDLKLPSRVLGIVDYLKNNDIANYVILDDDYFNDYKLTCLNHYRISEGLTYKDLPKIKNSIINNFKYISYHYRKLGDYELVTNNLVKVLKKKYENDIR